MVFRKGENIEMMGVNGFEIECIKNYKYLGTTLTSSLSLQPTPGSKLTAAKGTIYSVCGEQFYSK